MLHFVRQSMPPRLPHGVCCNVPCTSALQTCGIAYVPMGLERLSWSLGAGIPVDQWALGRMVCLWEAAWC